MIRYGSVCSGVEAASLAWMPIGWQAAWFSEIEPFPCAVLKERFPDVPNLGDMTKIKIENCEDGKQKFTGEDGTVSVVPGGIDLLVGGTPCQDLSVAGKRAGIVEGTRSRLAFDFTRIAYESKAQWLVWENVPGVFSLNRGEDFAAFLSSLAGWDVAVPDGGWKNAGIVRNATDGNFGLAYRVLDAQYTRVPGFPRAIPQRRRRVFVVGYFGSWERAAEVLFDGESLFGDSAPKRVKGKGFTADIEGSVGETGRPWDNSGVNPTLNQCCSGSGIIGASDQELFSQKANGLVMDVNSPASGDVSGTICRESVHTATREGGGQGVDCYNGTLTGDTCMTVSCAATDPHHVPCCFAIAENVIGRKIETGGNGLGAQEELAYTQNATGVMGVCSAYDIGDRRRVLESRGVAPTMISKMGTGGNNVPVVVDKNDNL